LRGSGGRATVPGNSEIGDQDALIMFAKITAPGFGGIRRVLTADETGLREGGRFRLVSMTLPFCRAHLHEHNGTPCVTGYSEDGRRKITAL
jgi:hypothetical protein